MNHQNAGYAAQGSQPASPKADKPSLQRQIDTLAKTLSVCHDHASEFERAADRILGPTPQDASKVAGAPPSDTIERKLQEAIEYADALSARLMHASQRLNSAV